jgi:dihydroneopterin aldolase
MTTLFVSDLQFYAYHGVSEQEQAVGRRFRLDLDASLLETARLSDRLEDTVDYGAIAHLAVRVASESTFKTLERAAEAIGSAILQAFPAVDRVKVRIAKLMPPVDLSVAEVGVEIVLSRPS